jgi:glycosyltransferase involved in cell wall biosynthesis
MRTYQHAPFVAQAIESVLLQRTGARFELVIGEDCSPDGTREIVEAYARGHPEIVRTVLPERNVGHGEMLRRALGASRGALIAYIDGDDYWTSPAKLERQVRYLAAEPNCHDCFHDVSLVYDEAGIPSGNVSPGLGEGRFGLEQIVMECFPPAPSMMFRRAVVDALDPAAFESAWLDWLIHVEAAERGPLGYIAEVLAAYRVHRGGMFSALDRTTQLEEDISFYANLRESLPDQRQLIERCVAYRHAQLAIERLAVPFEACVVLVDHRRELRPYFNGRHARALPRREGRPVTELEAICDAARHLPSAVRDYGTALAAPGPRGCFAVVPRGSAEWVGEQRELRNHLATRAIVVSEDEWSTVYDLQFDRAVRHPERIARVEALAGAARSPAAFLDAPVAGSGGPAHAIVVAGWVVGEDSPAVAVDFETAGEVVWRAPVNRARPDVAAAFPDGGNSPPGFQSTLNVSDIDPEAEVIAVAIFADRSRLPVARLWFEEVGGTDERRP